MKLIKLSNYDGGATIINAAQFSCAFRCEDCTEVYCAGIDVAICVKETPEKIALLMTGKKPKNGTFR